MLKTQRSPDAPVSEDEMGVKVPGDICHHRFKTGLILIIILLVPLRDDNDEEDDDDDDELHKSRVITEHLS